MFPVTGNSEKIHLNSNSKLYFYNFIWNGCGKTTKDLKFKRNKQIRISAVLGQFMFVESKRSDAVVETCSSGVLM